MAPPLQAISILHHLLLATSMLVMVSSSELAEPASGSGYRFQLVRLPPAAGSAVMRYSEHDYLMVFHIGDSLLSGIADTGSDLIWTNKSELVNHYMSCPCNTAGDCSHGHCELRRVYGDGTVVECLMGMAKLKFGESNRDINIGGCNHCHMPTKDSWERLHGKGRAMDCKAYRAGGIVGLNRGKLSLVTQLQLSNFSYCLPDYREPQRTGLLKLDDLDGLPAEDKQETKLVKIAQHPSYYVQLKSIEMNGTKLSEIPDGCSQQDSTNGDGCMLIDSGTSFSRLPEDALREVKKHVKNLMKEKHQKEPNKESRNKDFTCYHGKELPENMPEMVLHFHGGAKMAVPVENYMYLDQEDSEFCLVFRKALDNSPRMSILGNFQQQNIRMLFDIERETLSFVKHTCGQAEEKHAAV